MSTTEDTGSADRCSTAPSYPGNSEVVGDRPDEIRVANAARTLHLRRQLAEAAEHGVALLAALGLPRLVEPDFEPVDREMIGDALDVVIAHLDALDAPEEDREPYLAGWYNGASDPTGEGEPSEGDDEDDGISEPSLGAAERHPTPMLMFGGVFTDRSANCRQTRWADGGRQDLEGEITDELHDGDGEDLEAEPDEPNLGATEAIDQTAWGESADHDREFDATDCIDRHKPVMEYEASVARRSDMVALVRRAETLRRGVQAPTPHVYRDNVRPIAPGVAMWGGPL